MPLSLFYEAQSSFNRQSPLLRLVMGDADHALDLSCLGCLADIGHLSLNRQRSLPGLVAPQAARPVTAQKRSESGCNAQTFAWRVLAMNPPLKPSKGNDSKVPKAGFRGLWRRRSSHPVPARPAILVRARVHHIAADFPSRHSHKRPEQGGFRSHDADLALPGLDALGQLVQMIPPITVPFEVDALVSSSGELTDRCGVDGIVLELSCLY